MPGVDLIPIHRQVAMRCRRRISSWLTVGLAVGSVSVLAGIGSLGIDPGGNVDIDHRLARANREIAQSELSTASVRAALSRAEGKLQTLQRIGPQPDWSILLAMLAQNTGDGVVLRRCTLVPEGGTALSEPGQLVELSRTGFVLQLSGAASSQTAIAEFVLRLEASGLLDSVTLLKSLREQNASKSVTAFEIECVIRPRERRPS